MSTPFSYFDLIEMFAKPGCAVCNLLLRDAERFIDSLLYEFSNDPDIQDNFRASRGLCNEHAWQLAQHRGSVLNIAVLYAAALDEMLAIVEGEPAPTANSSWLARLLGTGGDVNVSALADSLEPTQTCPACNLLADSERFYIQTISQYATDARFQEAYQASGGLCLAHFRAAIRATRIRANLRQIISVQTGVWERLRAELETLKDKYDANRADVALEDEGESWRRAIRLIAGERGVFGLNRR